MVITEIGLACCCGGITIPCTTTSSNRNSGESSRAATRMKCASSSVIRSVVNAVHGLRGFRDFPKYRDAVAGVNEGHFKLVAPRSDVVLGVIRHYHDGRTVAGHQDVKFER